VQGLSVERTLLLTLFALELSDEMLLSDWPRTLGGGKHKFRSCLQHKYQTFTEG